MRRSGVSGGRVVALCVVGTLLLGASSASAAGAQQSVTYAVVPVREVSLEFDQMTGGGGAPADRRGSVAWVGGPTWVQVAMTGPPGTVLKVSLGGVTVSSRAEVLLVPADLGRLDFLVEGDPPATITFTLLP